MPKKPMYQKIYEDILSQIQSGTLMPGDRIESEESLAKRYDVSRITTKKSLTMLYEEGLIVRKPGIGSFVSEPSTAREASDDTKHSCKKIGFIIDYVGNSFALNLFNAISRQAIASGFQILISVTHSSQETEMQAIDNMKKSNCDGIILIPVIREFYNLEIIRSIADSYPIVTIDRELIGLPAPCISTDHRKSCEMLTQRLLDLGHKKIAFLAPRIFASKSEELRALGYGDAMRANSLEELIFYPSSSFRLDMLPGLTDRLYTEDSEKRKTQYQTLSRELWSFLDENPDLSAVVCCTHPTALWTHDILTKHGKSVPGDISIACFDEIEPCYRDVYFTHIEQDAEQIAAHAIKAIDAMFAKNNGTGIPNILIPGTVIEGNTTAVK